LLLTRTSGGKSRWHLLFDQPSPRLPCRPHPRPREPSAGITHQRRGKSGCVRDSTPYYLSRTAPFSFTDFALPLAVNLDYPELSANTWADPLSGVQIQHPFIDRSSSDARWGPPWPMCASGLVSLRVKPSPNYEFAHGSPSLLPGARIAPLSGQESMPSPPSCTRAQADCGRILYVNRWQHPPLMNCPVSRSICKSVIVSTAPRPLPPGGLSCPLLKRTQPV